MRCRTNIGQVGLTLCIAVACFSAPLTAQNSENLPIRGVVRAVNTAAISSDLAVPIKQLKFKPGQKFKRGDTLVEFECDRFVAERGTLLAERNVQFLAYKNNLSLKKHRAIGEFDVKISKAKLAKADAEIKRLDVRIGRCVVSAPFDGQVKETNVLQYETPKVGTPFISIIETGDLEIDFIVPSKWLAWIDVGSSFSFRIDETGKSYDGQVSRLGASVDPVSQTIDIRGRFAAKSDSVFAGMSGSAQFSGSGS